MGIGNADSIVDSGEWGSRRSAERKRFADSALDAPTRAAPVKHITGVILGNPDTHFSARGSGTGRHASPSTADGSSPQVGAYCDTFII
jgi:hypothetical protein